ncbi:DnaJ domain-containing protein [Mucilaginibacter sp. UR6-1]|uniref:J domain-containing protein n=1 Tax=Mucilaginibacter sp. UR6-1 TaxID=1435643 RepID=UPI001E30D46D|nr:J domain-containing protein [Mucilaginibacter sp. UR6-1]MCC8410492.1 DnaJ domain-containing protein [Mucilaginibacter sp. UR6-1]
MKNFYSVLQLEPPSNPNEIRKAFKFLATKYHPDKHNNDSFFAEKFIEIKEAYDILNNPTKKEEYDRLLYEFLNPVKQEEPAKQHKSKVKPQNEYDGVTEYIYWAQEWFNKGNLEKALEEISKALKLWPNDGYLYHIQGEIYRAIAQPHTALKKYNKAIELGYKDSKHEIVAIETLKQQSVERYESVLYKCFGIHVIIALIVTLSGNPDDRIGLSISLCIFGLIALIIITRRSVAKYSKEATVLLNSAVSINVLVTVLILSLIGLPFILPAIL